MFFLHKRRPYLSHIFKGVMLLVVSAGGLALLYGMGQLGRQAAIREKYQDILGLNGPAVIREVLPLQSVSSEEGKNYIYRALAFLTGVSMQEPATLLASQISIPSVSVAAARVQPEIEEGGEEDFYLPEKEPEPQREIPITPEEFPPVQLNGEPMVLLYTTHNAESYKPSDGASKLEGKNGGVAAVAKQMSSALESKHSLKTVYTDMIHDYPDWAKSYVNSMRTLQTLLQKYTRLQLVIDIHRDAGLSKRGDTLVKINGRDCAKVMIVVGTEHPRWRQNLAFAQKLADKAEELYPGLIKTVRALKDRRYNQHLHPRALLFEFGSDLNTRQDALNSAVLMADVIAEVLKGR